MSNNDHLELIHIHTKLNDESFNKVKKLILISLQNNKENLIKTQFLALIEFN